MVNKTANIISIATFLIIITCIISTTDFKKLYEEFACDMSYIGKDIKVRTEENGSHYNTLTEYQRKTKNLDSWFIEYKPGSITSPEINAEYCLNKCKNDSTCNGVTLMPDKCMLFSRVAALSKIYPNQKYYSYGQYIGDCSAPIRSIDGNYETSDDNRYGTYQAFVDPKYNAALTRCYPVYVKDPNYVRWES